MTLNPAFSRGAMASSPWSPHWTTTSGARSTTVSTLGRKSAPAMVAVFLDSGKRVPKMPSLLAWRVDSLMPTMRAWEPSTAAIIEGAGMIAVAIRSTRTVEPDLLAALVGEGESGGLFRLTSCRGSREEQAPRAPAPARAAAHGA